MQGFAEPHALDHAEALITPEARGDDRPLQPRPSRGAVGKPVADPTPATIRLYASDWTRFVRWCQQQHRPALPASSETLAAFLLATAPGLSRGARGRSRAAISAMHRQAGLPVLLLSSATHKALRDVAKPRPAVRSKPVATAASLIRMAQRCPRDLSGLRDRALLLLAAATLRVKHRGSVENVGPEAAGRADSDAGVARMALLALDAEHVRFTAAGVVLSVRSRLDEAEPSRSVMLMRAIAAAACPVRALEDWLRSSDTAFGPVFRKVDRWGNVEHARLAPDAWYRILARRGGVLRPQIRKHGKR